MIFCKHFYIPLALQSTKVSIFFNYYNLLHSMMVTSEGMFGVKICMNWIW